MRRRKKVEGLILDLTRIVEGVPFTFEELIVEGPVVEKVVRKRQEKKEKPVIERVERICSSCDTVRLVKIDDCGTCFMCRRLHDIKAEVAHYLRDAYKGPCSLCGGHYTMYHYDHKNMFDKKASVLDLVHEPLEVIKAEIAKCHLVCIPCHSKITAAEARLGYTKKKIRLNKSMREGVDVTCEIAALAVQYAQDFDAVYDGLRGSHGK